MKPIFASAACALALSVLMAASAHAQQGVLQTRQIVVEATNADQAKADVAVEGADAKVEVKADVAPAADAQKADAVAEVVEQKVEQKVELAPVQIEKKIVRIEAPVIVKQEPRYYARYSSYTGGRYNHCH